MVTLSNTQYTAAAYKKKKLCGVQFHPEVVHTQMGKKILHNFLYKICGCKRSWTMKSFAKQSIEKIREQVGDKKVILATKNNDYLQAVEILQE